ncbi:MAG: DUF5615 family PIN-like protein [Phycisphaerales bacterium]|nr:DUF5615 family PIN-like protein [Phycisphaerales bacterium]
MSRYLANENFPAQTVLWLRERGDDVVHAAETLAGSSDLALLEPARAQDRIVLTFDRDYGELVFHQGARPAPGIVLFRLRQSPPTVVLPCLESFFAAAPDLDGFFTVAAPGQFRQTPLRSSGA